MTEILILKSLVFIFFIGLSAFFSSAETAFTATNRIKLRSLLNKNKKDAKHLEFLLQHPKKLLTCILIGNNLANIAATSFATAFFLELLASLGITDFATTLSIITVIITIILLIFGEITPKTLAMKNPGNWAFKISRPIYYIYHIEYPIIILFYSLTNWINNLIGVETSNPSQLTEEEIKLLIQVGQEDGILEKEERKMIYGVINVFDKVVREIMTPRTDMISIEFNNSITQAIHLINHKGHSRIPVYEDKIDNIVGFIYAKDLLNIDTNSKNLHLKQFMRDAIFIPETKQIQSLLQQMRQSKFHLAIVVDEHGGVSGLVTMEDIIEEIVGEIQDEYDKEKSPIHKLNSSHYTIDASVSIEELAEILNHKFPENDDYDTVAGFILSQLGSFPKKNDKITYKNFDFIVKDIHHRRIKSFDVIINKDKKNK